jgi:hypothetical protein
VVTCCGCASTRAPSPIEFNQIVAAIRSYETNGTSVARNGQHTGVLWENAPLDIRIKEKTAVARYKALGYGQIAFVPTQTVLEHVSLYEWRVLSQEDAWPWWWYVIGAK